MLLSWRIRYLDSRDRRFKDRDLWLSTDDLDPVSKAAVEATYALCDSNRRPMLRHRSLFKPEQPRVSPLAQRVMFCIPEYFEDETGREISLRNVAVTLSDNPDAVMFPSGFQPHDVEFCMAEKPAIRLEDIRLQPDQLHILGLFTRDARELMATAFYREGPGSLSGSREVGRWQLQTAVTDEELRSVAIVFRRLFMQSEPANFSKGVTVFAAALAGHPVADWVRAIEKQYRDELAQPPNPGPMFGIGGVLPFTRKLLIEVFLYTRIAHQPDARREREYAACLKAVGGSQDALMWLFLHEVWLCAIHIANANGVISDFYDRYKSASGAAPRLLGSLRDEHPGLGTAETKAAREERVLAEKADELAKALWQQAGSPPGGHLAWVAPALEQLNAARSRPENGN